MKCGRGACFHSFPGKYIPTPQLEKMVVGKPRNVGNQTEFFMGIVDSSLAVRAADNSVRNNGGNGGTGRVLLGYILDKGIVDALLVAGLKEDKSWVRAHMVKPRLHRPSCKGLQPSV